MNRSYDTAFGICEYLDNDLDGLHRLITDRIAAGYDRKEKLGEWIVVGRWWFDRCGNCSWLTFEAPETRAPVNWIADGLPRVISPTSLENVLGTIGLSGAHRPAPPTSGAICPECDRNWTLKTAHDAVFRLEHWEHLYCAELARERIAMAEYRDILGSAMLGRCPTRPIPNEYWKGEGNAPWCLTRTPYGSIKMGWRKRVISIEWDDIVTRRKTGLDYKDRYVVETDWSAEKLFPAEETTKSGPLIHAWSTSKAIEYLTVLATKMRSPA